MKIAVKMENIAFLGENSDGRCGDGGCQKAEGVGAGFCGGGGWVKEESPSESVKAVMVFPLEGSSGGGRVMITTPWSWGLGSIGDFAGAW